MAKYAKLSHSLSNGNQTLIDHVFLSNISQFNSCSVLPPIGNSDHNCVEVVLLTRKTNVQEKLKTHRVFWNYSLADFERANEMQSSINVGEFIEDDMDQAWSKWEEQFISVMRQCIPTVLLKLKKSPPWLTSDLLRAIRSRNISYRRARKTAKPDHLDCYKKKRNIVANMLKTAKSNFFSQLDPSIPKSFWKIANYFTKQKCSIPVLKSEDGQSILDNVEKATLLNNYFAQCLLQFNNLMTALLNNIN